MMQVIKQTRDEKIAMYMKSTKRELVEMLATCNEHIDRLTLGRPLRPQWQQGNGL